MNTWRVGLLAVVMLSSQFATPAQAQQSTSATLSTGAETGANTQAIPKQILKTGINLNSSALAPNTMQLANTIGFTPLLDRIQNLRSQVNVSGNARTLDSLALRQDLFESKQQALLLIQKAMLDIDFTVAEISAEQNVYSEILSTYTSDRDKAVARTNAISFISNGILWAVCEGLAIPGYKNANFAIPSGIVGIPAGVVPSIASLYTFKQLNGKKTTSEVEPNMLAKLFNYPTTADIEYPASVWQYLHQVPADADGNGKNRLDQMIDRWVADANMPAFTNRNSKRQLDVITASVAQKKGLSIATLTARQVMLEQLSAEINKMKRMLLEMAMAVQGEKQMTASTLTLPRIGSSQLPGENTKKIASAEGGPTGSSRYASMQPTNLADEGLARILDMAASNSSKESPQGVP